MRAVFARVVVAASLLVMVPVAALASDTLRQRVEAVVAGHSVEAAGEALLARIALSNFYLQRNYTLAWSRAEHREAFLQALSDIHASGLDPADYHERALAKLEPSQDRALTPEQIIDRDLLFTDGFLLLASHLLEGKVNPETIDAEWLANRRQRVIEPLLTLALTNSDIDDVLQTLQPQQAGYRKLIDARTRLLAYTTQPWPEIVGGPLLKPGGSDPRVPAIRERLRVFAAMGIGDGVSAIEGSSPLGSAEQQLAERSRPEYYDPELVATVRVFQERHGLDSDAVIGTGTLAALNFSPANRINQIDVNLERWRWLPDDLGESHILVNIAAFELVVVKQNTVYKRHRVIVGRPFRRTPVFSDKIRYIVFNPTWTVPKTLLIQDKIPEIIRDPSYVRRLGFKIYRGWGADRTEISPESIDWKTVSRRNFPYQLVQDPGPQNALGQVKFMFPNKFDIYLHDTPSRELFSKSERSFSSGCIRVETPLELAGYLLADVPGWDDANIQRVVQNQKLATVYLKKPMPVHMQYWTAWVDDDSRLQFRKDLYERDLRLQEALYSHLAPTSP